MTSEPLQASDGAMVLAEKRCTMCDDTKPLSEFPRNRNAKDGFGWECKACARSRVQASNDRRRAEIGDEAFRAEQAENVRRHRARHDGAAPRERVYRAARGQAIAGLIERHRREFDALLQAALYEAESERAAPNGESRRAVKGVS